MSYLYIKEGFNQKQIAIAINVLVFMYQYHVKRFTAVGMGEADETGGVSLPCR